jgi:beta-galactosidase
VGFSQVVPLRDMVEQLGEWTDCDDPVSADELGQVQGLTLYQAAIDAPGPAVLEVGEVRDRAQVFLERQPVGVLARDHHETALSLPSGAQGMLELLVEDQGRVNYGPRIGEPKGLIGPVTINGEPVRGWRVMPLPLADVTSAVSALRALPASPIASVAGPAFARAVFDLATPGLAGTADLFLSTAGLGKGIAWLNGSASGGTGSHSPQRTLYVPGPVTGNDANDLVILELGAAVGRLQLLPYPDLRHTEP